MPSDRARVTYDPTRKWRGLIAQQGRVALEADWNEAAAITEDYHRRLMLDLVGSLGAPQSASAADAGYAVSPVVTGAGGPATGDLELTPGVIYVGGERLELDAPDGGGPVVWSAQPEWLDRSTDPLWTAGTTFVANAWELVFLLAYEAEVSAVEDPALVDIALGGPDTMQRRRIIQHIVRAGITPPRLETDGSPEWQNALSLLAAGVPQVAFGGAPSIDQTTLLVASPATLQVSFSSPAGASGSGSSGYLGMENQLLRVMVAGAPNQPSNQGQTVPPTIVWDYDDASSSYRIQGITYDAASGHATLSLATLPVDSYHIPVPGQTVELLRDAVALTATDYIASPTGPLATVVGYAAGALTVAIDETVLVPFQTQGPPSPPPVVTSLVPSAGVPAGATRVTVAGSGFTGATQVMFGSTPGAGLIVLSDGELTVFSPQGTGGDTPSVQVTTPNGTSTAGPEFTYTAAATPDKLACTPAAGGLAGGTLVVVSGTGLTATTGVTFGTQPGLAVTVLSDTELTVTSPPAASAATVPVTVVTTAGSASAGDFAYSASPPPQVLAIQPAQGGPDAGTAVTLTGSGFTGATAVTFSTEGTIPIATNATQVVVVNDNLITAVAPAATSLGSVAVTVTGAAASSPGGSSAPQYSYAVLVTGVSPTVVSLAGGTEVTISGVGFNDATGVSFGGVAAGAYSVISDSEIVAVSPAWDAEGGTSGGIVDVVVTFEVGGTTVSSSSSASDELAYAATPQPYLRVWQSAPSGTAPRGAAPGTFAFVLGDTGVTATLASSDPGGRFRPGDFWRFALRPVAPTVVDPPRYLTAPQPPDGPRTWICPLAYVNWVAETSVIDIDADADMAAASALSGAVTILVPGFLSLVDLREQMAQFVKIVPPTVTSLVPPVGSPYAPTPVTINGNGFANASAVTFGSQPGTQLRVISNTQLSVLSPPQVSAPVAVTVTTAAGASSGGPQFAYVGVSAVTPPLGLPGGGDTVKVSGSGFTGADSVTFGAAAGSALTVDDDSDITVTSPPGAPGAVDIVVTGPSGSSPTAASDQFVYAQVSSVGPPSGPQTGGTLLSILGSGFSAIALEVVTLGGIEANATVVSDSEITLTTPPSGQPGNVPVLVVTAAGAVPSAGSSPTFYYTPGKSAKEYKEKEAYREKLEKETDKFTKEREVGKGTGFEKIPDTHLQSIYRPSAARPGAERPSEATEATEPRAAEGAAAEPKPPETVGQAFITPEERPPVGDEPPDPDPEPGGAAAEDSDGAATDEGDASGAPEQE